MGRALKDTEVKVPGAAGPVGKGMPISQFAGKGGAFNALRGRPMDQNMKMPGFKSLMKKGIASGKLQKPALPQGSMFARMFPKNPKFQKQGGLFSGLIQKGIDSGKMQAPAGWPKGKGLMGGLLGKAAGQAGKIDQSMGPQGQPVGTQLPTPNPGVALSAAGQSPEQAGYQKKNTGNTPGLFGG